MTEVLPQPSCAPARLPEADALVVGASGGTLLTTDGELRALDLDALKARLAGPPLLLCHARAAARRVGLASVRAFDLLELFAFVRPARFCLPTPRGLAEAVGLPLPHTPDDAALTLPRCAERLLRELAHYDWANERSDPVAIAWSMGKGGWPWAPFALAALGKPHGPDDRAAGRALQVWHRLPEWTQEAPPPPPGPHPVAPREARRRLADLLGAGAEPRPQQSDYASAVTPAFAPRAAPDAPNLVLAEAGTGVGKTLGYLAPATLWAEINKAPVWVSTYTRNLQHQIDRELDRRYPDRDAKVRKVVIRKGRENYLCLLNYEEATGVLPLSPHHATAIGLMARWTAATRDGDLTGGDFPGWLADLIGRGRSLGLADRRGECVYSACPHYGKCFIERSIRRARRAEIVVANHALVMIQAALGGVDDTHLPTRYVFDEGHHLFDAADGAFAGHLSGRETAELRRWILGSETGRRRHRGRGLRRRVEGLFGEDSAAIADLDDAERAARALPGEGWPQRIAAEADGATGPRGPTEAFLALVRRQVLARAAGQDGPYSLECDTAYPVDGLPAAAGRLDAALDRLQRPLVALAKLMRRRLKDEADTLESHTRYRLEALIRALERRGRIEAGGWRAMLAVLEPPPPETGGPHAPAHGSAGSRTEGRPSPFGGGRQRPPANDGLRADDSREAAAPEAFVDWFAVEREQGREVDVGFYRHWIDPTVPFAAAVAAGAHGLVVTSATLTDGTGDAEADWRAAETRTGATHLPQPAIRAGVPSPFDYAAQTRVFVVRDVRKDDLDQVAAAYDALFLAAGGGALGLFTAIGRLRAVHRRIAEPLEAAGLPLYAQHVDGMDVATLVDIFRGEEHACLLGTDAVRDGVDVPGRSLRLIVFDRVPWPRPSILHRARRQAFGGKAYDDTITRLRLKQAYGRLVRRADDMGVFVLLDPMMPSRLAGAFPPGVAVERTGLAEAVAAVREFLEAEPSGPESATTAGTEDRGR